jgi:tripartite-type tricarboxylate transporter receptor subunit TctC
MKVVKLLKLFAGVTAICASAHSMAYPDKPITIVVPFPPGGSSDIVARNISASMTKILGQQIIVENKAGANGQIGATQVARAQPDGYTLLVGSIGVLSVNQSLYKHVKYDAAKDFDLLTVAVRTPNVLVVHPDFPAKTVQELIEYQKKNPDPVSFAASSIGASDHLTAALYLQKTGTTGVHVAFNGSGPTITNLLGGHVKVSFRNYGEVAGHIKSGKLRLLATTSDKRLKDFPNTPTMAEAGVDGLQVFSWQGVVAPKGLPKDVAAKLQNALVASLKDPGVTKTFNEMGFEVVANSSTEFAEFHAAEVARWKTTIADGKITVD